MNSGTYRLRIISAAAALIMMTAIFYMSAQNGETSASLSGGVTETILEKTDPDYSNLGNEDKTRLSEHIGFIIRKLAHFCEFFILGGIMAVFAFTFDISGWLAALYPLLGGTIYAVSDEIHQYFVPGRSCKFTDMLIDCAGVICACALIWFIAEKIKNKTISEEKRNERKTKRKSGVEL